MIEKKLTEVNFKIAAGSIEAKWVSYTEVSPGRTITNNFRESFGISSSGVLSGDPPQDLLDFLNEPQNQVKLCYDLSQE